MSFDTILVTGGAGFIGSHLVDRLLATTTSRVVVLDSFSDFYAPEIKRANVRPHLENPRYQLIQADIRNFDELHEAFAETAFEVGPWLRGGPTTVRGLADGQIGLGGAFGGNHPAGGTVGFADGSVRFLTDRIEPTVFRALLTINGGPGELIPD